MSTRSLFSLLSLAVLVGASPAWGQLPSRTDSGLVIEINVPAFRLEARVDTQVLRTFKVAVGMRRYPTPTGEFTIAEVQWNPWWYPPDSKWASKDRITPPGPGNPMGRVKMPLGSTVLVHGTPIPSSIGTAASHACIRMRNADAIALARLVQLHGGAPLPAMVIDSILRDRRISRRVVLGEAVPVHIVYRLVELRGDDLQFHPDIYRRGRDSVEADALRLLIEAGHDTATIDRELLGRVAAEGARAHARVQVKRLLSGSR